MPDDTREQKPDEGKRELTPKERQSLERRAALPAQKSATGKAKKEGNA